MRTVVFRVDMGSEVGGGHYSRATKLAEYFFGYHIVFLIEVFGDIEKKQYDKNNHYFLKREANNSDEIEILMCLQNVVCIIFDITTTINLQKRDFAQKKIELIAKTFNIISVVFDGWGAGALISEKPRSSISLLITPYVGAEIIHSSIKQLTGPKYFITPRRDKTHKKLIDKCKVNGGASVPDEKINVLVTFGQSDTQLLTEMVLKTIADSDMEAKLNLRVIIGAYFGTARTDYIIKFTKNHPCIQIIERADRLNEHYQWAGIAISASGLTKYELAYFGTPSILISASELDYELNKPFSLKGTCIDLGTAGQISPASLLESIDVFIKKPQKILEMARAGRYLIDGKGAGRILDEIENLLYDRNIGVKK